MKNLDENLISRAKSILENNWRGGFTVPSPTLYPHQWSWDSAFIAIGYSHYALDYAKSELDSILQGQWDNGLLPHIIFNPKAKGYFPDFKYWKTDEYSPTGTLTSGIIQPPVHAIVALEYFDHSHDKKTTKLVPKIKKIPPISLRKPRSWAFRFCINLTRALIDLLHKCDYAD